MAEAPGGMPEAPVVYGGYQVHPRVFTDINLFVRKGETVVGRLREVAEREFTWLILDEGNFRKYIMGEIPTPELLGRDVRADSIHWKVPKDGLWYLILEAYSKPSGREVLVDLRRRPGEGTAGR